MTLSSRHTQCCLRHLSIASVLCKYVHVCDAFTERMDMYLFRLYNKDEGVIRYTYTLRAKTEDACVYSITPNLSCMTGLYQNAVGLPH